MVGLRGKSASNLAKVTVGLSRPANTLCYLFSDATIVQPVVKSQVNCTEKEEDEEPKDTGEDEDDLAATRRFENSGIIELAGLVAMVVLLPAKIPFALTPAGNDLSTILCRRSAVAADVAMEQVLASLTYCYRERFPRMPRRSSIRDRLSSCQRGGTRPT